MADHLAGAAGLQRLDFVDRGDRTAPQHKGLGLDRCSRRIVKWL
jgi:hypothetical protein